MTPFMARVAALALSSGLSIRPTQFNALCRLVRDKFKDTDTDTDTDKIEDIALHAALQAVAKDAAQHFHGDQGSTAAPDHGKSLNQRGMEKLDRANADLEAKRRPTGDGAAIRAAMAKWSEENAARLEKLPAAIRLDLYETKLAAVREGRDVG